MIITKLKSQYTRVSFSALGLSAQQNRRIGEFAKDQVVKRVSRGIGSDDNPMPPLSGFDDPSKRYLYANRKFAKTGSRIRDLRLTGEMLDNLSVRSADEERVVIDVTTTSARTKAWANEKRAPWLNFSDSDITAISRFAGSLFVQNVRRMADTLFRFGSARKAA